MYVSTRHVHTDNASRLRGQRLPWTITVTARTQLYLLSSPVSHLVKVASELNADGTTRSRRHFVADAGGIIFRRTDLVRAGQLAGVSGTEARHAWLQSNHSWLVDGVSIGTQLGLGYPPDGADRKQVIHPHVVAQSDRQAGVHKLG